MSKAFLLGLSAIAAVCFAAQVQQPQLKCSGNACKYIQVGHQGNLTTFADTGKKKIKLTLRIASRGIGAPCGDPTDYHLVPHGLKQGFQQAICDLNYQANYE